MKLKKKVKKVHAWHYGKKIFTFILYVTKQRTRERERERTSGSGFSESQVGAVVGASYRYLVCLSG